MECEKCKKNRCTERKKPANFQIEPPFPKGSDQEEMKVWEMKGPEGKDDNSSLDKNLEAVNSMRKKWGGPPLSFL